MYFFLNVFVIVSKIQSKFLDHKELEQNDQFANSVLRRSTQKIRQLFLPR